MLRLSRFAVLVAFVAMALAMGGLACGAYAHEVPDLDQTGAIEVTMELDGHPVGGGAIALYRVGDVQENDGNYSFVLTDSFMGSGVALDDIQSADVAKTLATYASDNGVAARVKRIGASGKVSFDNVQVGLYLLVQTRPATGYSLTNPFLVAVPTLMADGYYYVVDASPKVEIAKLPEPPVTPNQPSEVPQTGDGTASLGAGMLTGMVLLVMGMALLSAGGRCRISER